MFIVYHSITNVQQLKRNFPQKNSFFPGENLLGLYYENLQLLKYHLIYWTEAATQRWGSFPPVFPSSFGRVKIRFQGVGVGDREVSLGE